MILFLTCLRNLINSDALGTSSFLLLVVRQGATSSFQLLVVMPLFSRFVGKLKSFLFLVAMPRSY